MFDVTVLWYTMALRPRWLLVIVPILFHFAAREGLSWVYPEHRAIMARAIRSLSVERQRQLQDLWARASQAAPGRLSAGPIDDGRELEKGLLDWAAWPALAGDHSCSVAELMACVQREHWTIDVARIAAQLEADLRSAMTVAERTNAMRNADVRLQRADPQYATRAGSGNAHFLRARTHSQMELSQYILECLSMEEDLNAVAVYIVHHERAKHLLLDAELPALSGPERARITLMALAYEAFAIHFLQDMFSSGHTVGTWGNTAERKGTHDYYCEHGLEIQAWDGTHAVVFGDAYMQPSDEERASRSVTKSLEAFLDAVRVPSVGTWGAVVDTLTICGTDPWKEHVAADIATSLEYRDILSTVPIPGLRSGAGALPRFRTELGGFLGFTSGVRAGALAHGFHTSQNAVGRIFALDVNVRVGFGLEGVLNESGDGLVFLEAGVRMDGPSSNTLADDQSLTQGGSITAAIPTRIGYQARLRMPFWILPGDLVLLAPLALADATAYQNILVQAGNGGAFGLQSGIATSFGRFQIILGRELAITLYGFGSQSDRVLMPVTSGDASSVTFVGLRTLSLELPIVAYRPFRSFTSDQTSGLTLHLYAGWDVPLQADYILPQRGALSPDVRAIATVGVRLFFDWRAYW